MRSAILHGAQVTIELERYGQFTVFFIVYACFGSRNTFIFLPSNDVSAHCKTIKPNPCIITYCERTVITKARRLVGRRGGSGKEEGAVPPPAQLGGMGERCKPDPPSGSGAEPHCNF